jgi:hypothetical protein
MEIFRCYLKLRRWNTIFLLILLGSFVQTFGQIPLGEKPQLLVLTDIGGDPDDIQSLRRLLVYSNEFEIKGLIATATWGDKKTRKPGVFHVNKDMILDAISDYDKVRDNLLLHDKDYPTADELRSVTFNGETNRGVDNLVPGRSSAGSNHIIRIVDQSEKLLNIAIWGGAHDLAQALMDVKSTRTDAEISEFILKLRVYAIGDQDKKYAHEGTGEWIRENFPDIFYIESGQDSDSVSTAAYRGMHQNDAVEKDNSIAPLVRPGIEQLNNEEWVKANVTCRGPLGEGYPASVNIFPNSARNTRGVKEGDTPSWFYFLPNGLSEPEYPEWGCWGGRFVRNKNRYYTDALDEHWSGGTGTYLRSEWTVARWREAYQNDFAARMRWCVLPYNQTNHNPVAIVGDDKSQNVIVKEATAGQKIKLDAGKSYDPDGNKLYYKWWIYQEASSTSAIIKNPKKKVAFLKISKSARNGKIHVILEVKDDGEPHLYSYRRLIFNVR